MMTTLDGIPIPVAVSGPENGIVVVILGAVGAPGRHDDVAAGGRHAAEQA